MKGLIVLLVCVYLAGIGWWGAGRLDGVLRSWKRPGAALQVPLPERSILLYGADKSCLPVSMWETCDAVEGPELPAPCAYRLVLAVSENDLNNLLLCASARRELKSIQLIARCNDPLDREIFRQQRVDVTVSSLGELTALLSNWGRI